LIDSRRRAVFAGRARTLGRQLAWWLVLVTALALAIWAVLRFVSPAPPRAISMSTGPSDGAYHRFGQRYQEILRANGVKLELRRSSGGIENLHRLGEGSVSVGFVQGGTGMLALDADAAPESTPLRSLATVAFEPVWIFTHTLDLTKGYSRSPARRSPSAFPAAATTALPAACCRSTASWPATRVNRPATRRW